MRLQSRDVVTRLGASMARGGLAWFEYRGHDLTLQSLAAGADYVAADAYHQTLVPAAVSNGDAEFLSEEMRRVRALLRVYRPLDKVVVAVIDSGVNFNSSLLARLRWTNTAEQTGNSVDDDANGYVDDVAGWDFVDESGTLGAVAGEAQDNDPSDPMGHGTAVAALIAATAGQEATPWLRIMALRVASGSGRVGTVSPFALAQAITYASTNGAHVINISVGAATEFAVVHDAIAMALARGVKIIASAGNTGGPLLYPARQAGVFAVGSLDSDGAIAVNSARGAEVDIYTRGTNVLNGLPVELSNLPDSGTSYAAPIVTGLSAMLRAVIGNSLTGGGAGCDASMRMWRFWRPVSASVSEWAFAVSDAVEAETTAGPLVALWRAGTRSCGSEVTVNTLLRRAF